MYRLLHFSVISYSLCVLVCFNHTIILLQVSFIAILIEASNKIGQGQLDNSAACYFGGDPTCKNA